MRIVLGILLLVTGVAYPMAAVYWLNQRMARKPAMSSRQVGLQLALNGILPISLIFWGLALAVPWLWAIPAIRMVAAMTSLASLIIIAALRAARGDAARTPGATAAGDPEGSKGNGG